ncbi:MAG: hypothetical protein RSC92_05740, partial [Clostridia bacterium]
SDNNSLYVTMFGENDTMQLFNVNEEDNSIDLFNTENITLNNNDVVELPTPVNINIGFKSENEGVYEGMLDLFYNVNDKKYLFAQILIMAESIGEDERYRAIFNNFGLPDPINMQNIFKESNINEDNVDYELINEKSKFLALEYNNIFSYIGTYKSLINAVKWLGYDDIYFKEWFLNAKTNKLSSFNLSFNANERTNTLLAFDIEERMKYKKLNSLSLIYQLNKLNGEYDEFGVPETENCYTYSIDEIKVKLFYLKEWLETNIIGINCKIIDISGEAIYFERYNNLIYANSEKTLDIHHQINITPVSKYDVDLQDTIFLNTNDYVESFYNEDTHEGIIEVSIKELSIDSSKITASNLIDLTAEDMNGDNVLNPIHSLRDIQWRASIETLSAAIKNPYVDNDLLIIDNTIRYYDTTNKECNFICRDNKILIYLESANLRHINDNYKENIKYKIYKERSKFIIENLEEDNINERFFESNTSIVLETNEQTKLSYSYNDVLNVPILTIKNFNIRY